MHALLVLLAAFHVQTAAPPTTPTAEEQLLRAHRELAAAIEKSDTSRMAQLHADDFAGIGLGGSPTTKADMVASNNTATATLVVYDESNPTVKVHGATAIVTSRASLETRLSSGTSGGTTISRRHAVMRVWALRDGRWQVIASQLQPLVLAPSALQLPAAPKAGSAFQHLPEAERDVLAAHIAYVAGGPAQAQRRYAAGYLGVGTTGIVSGRPDPPTAPASANAAAPEVLEEPGRVFIRSANSTAVFDDFRIAVDGDTAAFTHRASYYNKAGTPGGRVRVGGVYVRRDGRWQQVLGQSTDLIAESRR